MYQIKFTLGDYSRDGHGMSDDYIVESNKPVEHLRELHFSCIKTLDFDIGDMCREYGENQLAESIFDILKEHKILDDECLYYLETNDFVIEDPDELLGIWLSVLIYLDPTLTLLVKTPDEIPSMHFYGYDEKKRHLNNPGYGLYE